MTAWAVLLLLASGAGAREPASPGAAPGAALDLPDREIEDAWGGGSAGDGAWGEDPDGDPWEEGPEEEDARGEDGPEGGGRDGRDGRSGRGDGGGPLPESRRWRVGLGLSFQPPLWSRASIVRAATGTGAAVKMRFEPLAHARLEARRTPRGGWGTAVGVEAGPAAKLESVSHDIEPSISSDGPSLFSAPAEARFPRVFVNVARRWGSLYVPLGVNYNLFRLKGTNGRFTGQGGGVGGQAGAGALLAGDRVALELSVSVLRYRAEFTYKGDSFEIKDGVLAGLALSATLLL